MVVPKSRPLKRRTPTLASLLVLLVALVGLPLAAVTVTVDLCIPNVHGSHESIVDALLLSLLEVHPEVSSELEDLVLAEVLPLVAAARPLDA